MARSTDLLAVSATEQDIANADKHTEHLRMVEKVLGEAQTRPRMAESALRVVLLYALRYETNRKNQVSLSYLILYTIYYIIDSLYRVNTMAPRYIICVYLRVCGLQISQFCRALEELGQDSSLVKTLLMVSSHVQY